MSRLRRAKSPPFKADTTTPSSGKKGDGGTGEKGNIGPENPATCDCDEALAQVKKWLDDDKRAGPFLSIRCTPDVFVTTANLLESRGDLPRMARDYDPATMTWYLRVRPHVLHEVGHSMLDGIKSMVVPQLQSGRFSGLANRLVWTHASPTCELSNNGKKEPDTSLMMRGRSLPTVVFEVGYSQSRAKLRLDAKRWLEQGRGLDGAHELKRKRGGEVRPVMLVVLISFEGLRPSDARQVDYTEVDFDAPGKTKPLSIFVEMWRLMPVGLEARVTRAAPESVATMCERKQFFPEVDPKGSVTIYLTDLLGSDKIEDPEGLVNYSIPLRVFLNAYEERLSMFREDEEDADVDDRIVVNQADVCANVAGEISGAAAVPGLGEVTGVGGSFGLGEFSAEGEGEGDWPVFGLGEFLVEGEGEERET